MNTLQLFWESKLLIPTTGKAFLEFLKSKTTETIEALPPEMIEENSLLEVENLGIIRINNPKKTLLVALGSFQEDFFERLHQLLEVAGAPEKQKTVEKELLVTLFRVIEPELKANQFNFDRSSVLLMPKKQLGKWSVFTVNRFVRFPFSTPHGKIHFDIPIIDSQYNSEKIREYYGFAENARIMMIDDSLTARTMTKHHLAMVGYTNIEECMDGKMALTKLKSSTAPFDLVISDWNMPNLTGIELLKIIRSDLYLKHLPVILITAESNRDEVQKAIVEKVSSYIVKPFAADTFYNSLKKASMLTRAKN